jgi:EAL domain-containing protein (putative c-di-GMP-specific phosphodiesterase class I)
VNIDNYLQFLARPPDSSLIYSGFYDPKLVMLSILVAIFASHAALSVTSLLRASGIDSALLKIELTESLVLDNVADSIAKMQTLKKLGVGFSMDDFNTGHSSLSYLKQLPLDLLKIDQSFVRAIVTDPNDAAFVQTIIVMANSMGLDVIAEGVETQTQLEFLRERGCPTFQGYLFRRPLALAQSRGVTVTSPGNHSPLFTDS